MSAIANFSRFIMGGALRRSRRSVPARPQRHQGGLWCRLCERFELVGGAVPVVDQPAEMMDAAEIEAVALVPAEAQDRHVEGAVAQEHAVGLAFASGLGAGDLHEVERLLVEFGGCVGILRRN